MFVFLSQQTHHQIVAEQDLVVLTHVQCCTNTCALYSIATVHVSVMMSYEGKGFINRVRQAG